MGNEEASGSPWISSLPENSAIEAPSALGPKNESCFSAVEPVSGWNMCVKWVAPFSRAQSFMAFAIESASAASIASPFFSAESSCLNASLGRRWRCTARVNTSSANG